MEKKCLFLIIAFIAFRSPAQIIVTNFSGLNINDTSALGSGATPPDTMGAVGTNQFVEFINGAFAVYNRNGVRQSLITDEAFWQNAGINPATLAAGITDPRIVFDATSGRWFASQITADNTSNSVLIGRSDTADASGTWHATNFVGSAAGFADYDTLGVDALAVYIGANIFDAAGNSTAVSFFSIPKTNLLAPNISVSAMTRFDNINFNLYGWTLQGVNNSGSSSGHGVMIAIDNATLRRLNRTTINNPGSPAATLASHVQIANAFDGTSAPATQMGGNTVDTLDDRFSGAVKQVNGYIFMANAFVNSSISREVVHWLILNETNNTILGEGIVSNANYDFFQPSIAANRKGKFFLSFNRSSNTATNGQISIFGALGTWSNTSASLGAPFLIKQGPATNFNISFDSAPYRWGDYSATMVDPTDEDLFWTIQEIPLSETAWSTQIAIISSATNRPTLGIARSNTSVALNWPMSTDPAYALQSSTNLQNSGAWVNVGVAPVFSTNQNVVTLNLTNPSVFFRLKK